jgi:DNA-binding transcriptional regulator YiaG
VTRQGVYTYASVQPTFKKLREAAGLTQAQVAEPLGVTIRSLTRWETGVLPTPKMAELALRYIVEKKKRENR